MGWVFGGTVPAGPDPLGTPSAFRKPYLSRELARGALQAFRSALDSKEALRSLRKLADP